MGQADEILRSVKRAEAKVGQGRLKIFMGMVAGVGKTYSMLKAAHNLKSTGKTPVIGYIETHGRKETEELVRGLSFIPRKKIQYKDVYLEEFDIDACLEMKPKLVLIDELAHTNVPGSRHEKRWQDVLEILNNGIDVFTTLNVQHIESRAETISSVVGIRINELVPDSVLDRADEIVLIDLIPDELIERLKSGKIYALDKVDVSTQNFFKVSNLTALREVALRLMADRVDYELKDLSNIQGIENFRINDKLMVAIFGSPYSESLIRHTRKLAYGLKCKWFAAYVNTDRGISEHETELLNKNIELVKQLGGEVISTQSTSVVEGLLYLAEQNGATQIVVGQPKHTSIIQKIFSIKSLPQKLVDATVGIDINVIAGLKKVPIYRSQKIKKIKKDFEFDWRGALVTVGYLANLTFLNAVILPIVHYRAIGIIYLMGITVGSLFIKNYNIFIAAFIGGLCWNIFFIPPQFTLHISEHEDVMLLALYIVAGLVIGVFTRRLKEKEEILRSEGNRANQLYNVTKDLSEANAIDDLIKVTLNQIERLFNIDSTLFIRPWNNTKDYDPSLTEGVGKFVVPPKEEYAIQWVIKNKLTAGRFTDTLPLSQGHYVPLIEDKEIVGVMALDASSLSQLNHDKKIMLDAIARQLSIGIKRESLESRLRTEMVSVESERIYKTLLNSVSHEIRTPLAAIKGFASVLSDPDVSKDMERVKSVSDEIVHGVERLDYVVQNLLDMSRLESGNLKLNLEYVDLSEIIRSAISKVKRTYGEKEVRLNIDKDLPLFYLDYFLIEQTVENIIRNAFIYTPKLSPIEVIVELNESDVIITINDFGNGFESEDTESVFKKFYRENPRYAGGLGLGLSICRAIIELHHGQIIAKNLKNVGKGASFIIRLPRELDRSLT